MISLVGSGENWQDHPKLKSIHMVLREIDRNWLRNISFQIQLLTVWVILSGFQILCIQNRPHQILCAVCTGRYLVFGNFRTRSTELAGIPKQNNKLIDRTEWSILKVRVVLRFVPKVFLGKESGRRDPAEKRNVKNIGAKKKTWSHNINLPSSSQPITIRYSRVRALYGNSI